jgi:hypothetical protein
MTASPLAPPVTFGSSFNDFYDREGLVRLDAAFVEWLKNANVDVHARLLAARAAPDAMAAKDESNLLIELARPLEDFVGVLFGVAHEAAELRARHTFQKSPFGVTLAGCPLEEKISEMNLLKSEGFSIGALAMIAVDNPMVAATGHRICNDCMKACIYQKQEPVDIPQARPAR